jgi:ABC-type branched-subunit amino acid transport system ATPase component
MIDTKGFADAMKLHPVLLEHADHRVAVLGPPCVGKSTLLRHIPGALDMDTILFPQLSSVERQSVFRKPWSPTVGKEMKRLASSMIIVLPGRPVFATVVIEVDFIIHLKIDDDLLQRRVMLRQIRQQYFEDVVGIQRQLEADILASGIPFIEFLITKENHDH